MASVSREGGFVEVKGAPPRGAAPEDRALEASVGFQVAERIIRSRVDCRRVAACQRNESTQGLGETMREFYDALLRHGRFTEAHGARPAGGFWAAS